MGKGLVKKGKINFLEPVQRWYGILGVFLLCFCSLIFLVIDFLQGLLKAESKLPSLRKSNVGRLSNCPQELLLSGWV